jgi:hypothetical protein
MWRIIQQVLHAVAEFQKSYSCDGWPAREATDDRADVWIREIAQSSTQQALRVQQSRLGRYARTSCVRLLGVSSARRATVHFSSYPRGFR